MIRRCRHLLLTFKAIVLSQVDRWWTWADTSCWRYQAWAVKPTSKVRPLIFFKLNQKYPLITCRHSRSFFFCWIRYLTIKIIKPSMICVLWFAFNVLVLCLLSEEGIKSLDERLMWPPSRSLPSPVGDDLIALVAPLTLMGLPLRRNSGNSSESHWSTFNASFDYASLIEGVHNFPLAFPRY